METDLLFLFVSLAASYVILLFFACVESPWSSRLLQTAQNSGLCSYLKLFFEMNNLIAFPLLHIWDFVTDIFVGYEIFQYSEVETEHEYLIIAWVIIFLFQSVLCSIWVYLSSRSISEAIMQFFHFRVFILTYKSLQNALPLDDIRVLKTYYTLFETVPQMILALVFSAIRTDVEYRLMDSVSIILILSISFSCLSIANEINFQDMAFGVKPGYKYVILAYRFFEAVTLAHTRLTMWFRDVQYLVLIALGHILILFLGSSISFEQIIISTKSIKTVLNGFVVVWNRQWYNIASNCLKLFEAIYFCVKYIDLLEEESTSRFSQDHVDGGHSDPKAASSDDEEYAQWFVLGFCMMGVWFTITLGVHYFIFDLSKYNNHHTISTLIGLKQHSYIMQSLQKGLVSSLKVREMYREAQNITQSEMDTVGLTDAFFVEMETAWPNAPEEICVDLEYLEFARCNIFKASSSNTGTDTSDIELELGGGKLSETVRD